MDEWIVGWMIGLMDCWMVADHETKRVVSRETAINVITFISSLFIIHNVLGFAEAEGRQIHPFRSVSLFLLLR